MRPDTRTRSPELIGVYFHSYLDANSIAIGSRLLEQQLAHCFAMPFGIEKLYDAGH